MSGPRSLISLDPRSTLPEAPINALAGQRVPKQVSEFMSNFLLASITFSPVKLRRTARWR
jgi:hypothetical protein